tara:strand:- start:860 stop:1846 length:987 start_codon:yes stop_codon:yes gene_type:complete
MLALTGAAGFIGSNFMAAWEAHEDRPIAAFDTIDSPEKQFNVDKRRNVTWVGPADILTFLQANVELIEVVVHLGAETSTTASDRSAVFAVNVDLSTALWTWCAENSIPFIYASSASVYGDGTQGFNDDLSLGALNALKPLNLYGQSKLAFDTFVSQAVFDGSPAPPQWAGLRFFNVYGPNEIHKGTQASVVSQMHPIAAKGDAYALFRSHREGIGNGKQKRDFVFVDDCTAVIRWLLETPTVTGLFNVGTGKARTFLDLARAVYTAADQPFTITWRDTPAHLQTHYQYFTEANMSRLEAVGYPDAFTSLEDGVTITIRDYLSNPNPYR